MRRFSLLSCGLSLAAIAFAVSARTAEVIGEPSAGVGQLKLADRKATADILPASKEAEQSLKAFKLAPGLQINLWAAEPMLANPVAMAFDEQGRLFVAETYRYGSSVLDIRDYMWMLEADMACRTIDDRLAMIRGKFGPKGEKELSIESDRIRLLEDADGDGKADVSTLFAEGFNAPLDGIGSGVLARRGSLWFTNIPSVWRFDGLKAGAKNPPPAGKPIELLRGFGVRFGYTGHDLHGLAFGPDGKLYFSIGDRGAHVPTKEGGVVDAPDSGSVFRCFPDGTGLELFATGLRNPQELVFTENGDLFTGDNDCDNGDMERLVHLVEGSDSGWRVGYQHAPLGKAGPWMFEKLWLPRFPEQAAYLLPPICNIEDGPSGVAYYPGTGLAPEYAGTFFICHFKGNTARSGIQTYTLNPAGATYAIKGSDALLRNALPVDVTFGPDGKLYYTDWVDGWPKSKRGRVFAISDPKHADDPLIKETQALIASDFTQKSPADLVRLLGHADWRVRLEAQYTLAERGAASFDPLAQMAAQADAPALARRHALWGLGQLAATTPAALKVMSGLLNDADSEIRAQSAKLLGDYKVAEAFDGLVAHLRDENSRVRFFAAQSLGKLGRPEATPALLALLRENDDRDLYLRHAAVIGLAQCADLPALATAAGSALRAERLGVLLAYRRLGRPEIARFLDDSDPFFAREAARAINDAPIPGAFPSLAALIEKIGPASDQPAPAAKDEGFTAHEALLLRVLNANFRLGSPAHASALAAYAARADAPVRIRVEALKQLALWPKPPARDRLVGVYRPLPAAERDPAAATQALSAVLPQLLVTTSPEPVRLAALATVTSLDLRSAGDAIFTVVMDPQQTDAVRAAALGLLATFNSSRLVDAVQAASTSGLPTLRLAALPIAARLAPDTAAPVLEHLLASGSIAEQKVALVVLGALRHPSANPLLAKQLRLLLDGRVAPEVELELLDAAAQRDDPLIKQLLAQRSTALDQGGPLASYRFALAGGDRLRGRKLFTSHPILACIRCHQVSGEGGDAGPDLSSMGLKYSRDYLLESVVKPNARIAPGFETVVVTLKNERVLAGTVTTEDSSTLSVKLSDESVVKLDKTEIVKRETAPSSMPEIYGLILTKIELRDLVEYVASLSEKPSPPARPRALRHLPE